MILTLMGNITLFCAISSADVYPKEIVGCFDTMKECEKYYDGVLECARCIANPDSEKTICAGYGISTHERNN